jgi:peptidoglycan hydrolase-like protein with peptidoglycan-binding domain
MQTIRIGSAGPAVVLLQRCLQNCLSFEVGAKGIDGVFGPKTMAAVN